MNITGSDNSGTAVPLHGAFAVLSIDPVASLEHLDDPQALLACEKLVSKKYVVYVTDKHYRIFNPDVPYQQYSVEFLVQGFPLTIPDEGVDSSMSIPVLPATDHPLARTPLRPSKPLPWFNCYLTPFITAEVRAPTLITEDPVVCELDLPEESRHDELMKSDIARRQERLDSLAAQAPNAHQESPQQPSSSSVRSGLLLQRPISLASAVIEGGECDSVAPASFLSETSVPEEDTTGDFQILFQSMLMANVPCDDMTTVNFTHDLSVVDQLNNPLGFYAEVEALSRIAEESRARRKEAAERSDAERYDLKTAKLLHRTPGRWARLVYSIKRRSANALRRTLCLTDIAAQEI